MTELVNDDFSNVGTAVNWAADIGITIAGGTARCQNDGLNLHDTQIPGNVIWMSSVMEDISTSGGLQALAIGDGTGAGFLIVFNQAGANLVVDWLSAYTSYDLYTGGAGDNDVNVALGTFNAANRIGVTVDLPTTLLRFWNGVTTAEPTGINSWDGRAAEGSLNYGALGRAGGNFLGIGTWDTAATPTQDFLDFRAGQIGAASEVQLMASRQLFVGP